MARKGKQHIRHKEEDEEEEERSEIVGGKRDGDRSEPRPPAAPRRRLWGCLSAEKKVAEVVRRKSCDLLQW